MILHTFSGSGECSVLRLGRTTYLNILPVESSIIFGITTYSYGKHLWNMLEDAVHVGFAFENSVLTEQKTQKKCTCRHDAFYCE